MIRRRRFPPAPVAKALAQDLALLPRLWTAGRRPLPDFLVIGTQRGGTTSLFQALQRHPGIQGAPVKEVHYFDAHEDHGEDWYRAHFPVRAEGGRVGEATPYYLFHPRCPASVHAMLPEARLVVVLRDPVERAVSHHRHEVRWGQEPEADLARSLALESERTRGEEERLLREPGSFSHAHNHWSYRARGEYARQLRAWLEHYPREQLHMVLSERLFAEPERELARVQEHVGVEPRDLGSFPHANSARGADLDPATRAELTEHYRPHNQELAELLGEDPGWEA